MSGPPSLSVIWRKILELQCRLGTVSSGSSGGISQLTGDVTAGPGSGSQAATIANDVVTYAKIQNISAASRLLGRGSAGGSGNTEEISLGANLSMSGTTLNAVGGGGGGIVSASGFYLDDGSVKYGPVFTLTPPVDGDFAWINQGGASTASSGGAVHLIAPQNVSLNLRIRKKSAPTVPYVITAAFLLGGADVVAGGLAFRQSSDGKLHMLQVTDPSTVVSTKYTSATVFSANYLSKTMGVYSVIWLRIADDNTNRLCSISRDGLNWQLFHSVGRTDFLTADEVGFWANASATTDAGLTLLSWKET